MGLKLKRDTISNVFTMKKVVLLSTTFIILALFFSWILAPTIDGMYYNPKAITYCEFSKDMTVDMYALNELRAPGYESQLTLVERKGYGAYNIVLSRYRAFGNREEKLMIKLDKNEIEGLYNQSLAGEIIPKFTDYERNGLDYELPLVDLKNTSNYTSIFVTMNEPVALGKALSFTRDYNQLVFKWMSIEYSDEKQHLPIGFTPFVSKKISFGDKPDEEAYPMFYLDEVYENLEDDDKSGEESFVKNHETHVRTLLKFLAERKEFVNIFDMNSLDGKLYSDALNFVNDHGVEVVGFLIYGESSDLVQFINEHEVYGIQILDMKVSKYSK